MIDLNYIPSALSTDKAAQQSAVSALVWTLCWMPLGFALLTRLLTPFKHVGLTPNVALRSKHVSRMTCLCAYGLSAILFWIPITGLNFSLANYAQGLMYTPSIALLLACLHVWQNQLILFKAPLSLRQVEQIPRSFKRTELWYVLIPLAIAFYPSALGAGLWDPYRLGYHPEFALFIAAINLVLWAMACRPGSFKPTSQGSRWYKSIAIWLTAALAAHALNLYESPNLWDVLFDPFAALWALGWGIKHFIVSRVFRTNCDQVDHARP